MFPYPQLKDLIAEELQVTERELHKTKLEAERQNAYVAMLEARHERLTRELESLNGN